MKGNELTNQNMMNEIGELYAELTAIQQTMRLTLDDLHENLKLPEIYIDEIKMDRHVMDRQTAALHDCIKALEKIAPDACYIG